MAEPTRVLILGGTAEAAGLARALAGDAGVATITSLAGRTRTPAAVPGEVRVGGFAKISKLAMGHLDLHSGRSQVDLDWLAERLGELGADAALQDQTRAANTANQVLELARQAALPLADAVAHRARTTAEVDSYLFPGIEPLGRPRLAGVGHQ